METPSETPWKRRLRTLLELITPDRVIAVVALAIIPCLLSAWLHMPIGKQLGISVSLSVPDILHTGSIVVNRAETYEQMTNEVRDILNRLGSFAENNPEISEALRSILPERG